jgi:integrase/recombinase XerD
MTALGPTLQAFFTQRLINQKRASSHTVTAYKHTFRLLLCYASKRTGKPPCELDFDDLDATFIGTFLDYLEADRHNSVRTRNSRLAAIHSLYRYAALENPEHAATIGRVLAIPTKRAERTDIAFLEPDEADAILAAPDRNTWHGRRDHALLVTALQTGLRVSELTGLCWTDVELGRGPHLRCEGKGRKQRATPLTAHTVSVLRAWSAERRTAPAAPLFPTSRGTPLSIDAVEALVAKYAATAQQACPTLRTKHVTVHTFRHACAMNLLRAGVEATVISLWLGHEDVQTTTKIYLHADMSIKEKAIAKTAPPGTAAGRYKPPDRLLAFLEGL